MDLIPGLLDDVGLQCLIRVPYDDFSSVSSVCRRWKAEIDLPEFWRRRRISGLSQKVVVMVQARVDPVEAAPPAGTSESKRSVNPVYRLTICEPETGKWSEMPPVPGYENGLPMFCQVAGAGLNLVLIGGWDLVTWEVSSAVFVYNFVSATWRRGADMPGGPRSFFASCSDSNRTVFVVGGHDNEKNALKTAMAYDVSTDEWMQLPDMARERDECKCVFSGGKLHVIGGYNTETQGQFSTSSESFDLATWQWDDVQEDFLDAATSPSSCLDGGDGNVYMCRLNSVVALHNSTWQGVAELPTDVARTMYVTAWQGKMFAIGSSKHAGPHIGYVLDLKSMKWAKIVGSDEYSGHVQSGCWLEL